MINSRRFQKIRKLVATLAARWTRSGASKPTMETAIEKLTLRSQDQALQCSVADQFRRAAGVVETQLKRGLTASSCQFQASEIIEATEYSLGRLREDLKIILPGLVEIGTRPIPISVERSLGARIEERSRNPLETALAA